MTARTILTSFTSGEISPRLEGRVDLTKYPIGCRVLENFLICPQGPVKSRPGFRFVTEVHDGAHGVRLVPFVFSRDQAYVLEFGHLYIRVLAKGENGWGPVVGIDDGDVLVTTPYAEDELEGLQFAQSADVLYIVHPDHPPMKLSRHAPAMWSIAKVSFQDGPYLDIGDTNPGHTVTMIPSAITGEVTLTASADYWVYDGDLDDDQQAQVGSLVTLKQNVDALKYKLYADGATTDPVELRGRFTVDASPGSEWRGSVDLQKSYDEGTTWIDVATFFYSTKQEFFEPDGGVVYRFKNSRDTSDTTLIRMTISYDQFGVARIIEVNSATVAAALVIYDFGKFDGPSLESPITATTEWQEGAWNAHRGYPTSVCFHEDRLWFGGTKHQPLTVWGSWVGDYENFMPNGNTDDATVAFTLSEQSNPIQWIRSNNAFLVGTIGGESRIMGSQDKPITATNISIRKQSANGSARGSAPVDVGPGVVFLQASRRRLREFAYTFESDSFQSVDLNLLADHIAFEGIKEIAYQQEPDSIIWAVRSDGVLLGLTYYRKEEVMGWHRHTTDGVFESICVIPDSLGETAGQDRLLAVIRRTIGGVQKRYIELLESHEGATAPCECFCVDSGIDYFSLSLVTGVSGLDHLEGKTVVIVADGRVITGKVVSSGHVSIPLPGARNFQVGLPYTCTLQTMRLDLPVQGGTIQGRMKKLPSATFRFLNTVGGKAGLDENTLDAIPEGEDYTGDRKMLLPGGFDRVNRIMVVQDQPLPMTLLAIIPEVAVNG